MMRQSLIVLLLATLAACSLTGRARTAPASPAEPSTTEPIPAPPPQTRQYRLGSAASTLVAQAHARAAAGDYPAATATLERALRIEPDNPLAWIELGRIQLAAGNPAQADSMGHKAIGLASGDPGTQAAAWRLIADALRVQRRNQEAAAASARAEGLAPH